MDYNQKILELFPDIEDLRYKLPKNPNHQWKKRDPSKIRGVVFHQELGNGSVEQVAEYHTGPKSHLRKGGVHSISYTFAVRKNGSLCFCNNLEEKTWSQGMAGNDIDENEAFVSIMFEGLFRGEGVNNSKAGEPTLAQIKTGIKFWEVMRDFYKLPNSSLYGHYFFGKPSCPGYTLQSLIEAIRQDEDLYKIEDLDLSTARARQAALKVLGYNISVDGIWGKGSKKSLEKFQKDHGLLSDGIWGPNTEKAIKKALIQASLIERFKKEL